MKNPIVAWLVEFFGEMDRLTVFLFGLALGFWGASMVCIAVLKEAGKVVGR